MLVHYHLFKNAGTSLDEALKRAFPGGWAAYERQHRIPASELVAFIRAQPELRAVSSHNAWLPAPDVPDLVVVPLVFVRHPLDRVRSVYDFERSHGADTEGARIARTSDIRGYVEWRLTYLDGLDRTIKDFQTMRLAPAGRGDDELACAIDAMERLPFVGLVEAYPRSLRSLQAVLAARMTAPTLKVLHANVTQRRPASLSARLEQLRRDLGVEVFQQLTEANAADLRLWRHLAARYAREPWRAPEGP